VWFPEVGGEQVVGGGWISGHRYSVGRESR
jgi:hypothetical protein